MKKTDGDPIITIDIYQDRIDGTVKMDEQDADKVVGPYVLVGMALIELLNDQDKELYKLLTKRVERMFAKAKELEGAKNGKTKKA